MMRAMQRNLHSKSESKRWHELTGYTVPELRDHIEKQFTPSMTWDNYGTSWHIDHIVPLSSFNFETAEDAGFRRAWSLSNLRPLPAKDNLKKRARTYGAVTFEHEGTTVPDSLRIVDEAMSLHVKKMS